MYAPQRSSRPLARFEGRGGAARPPDDASLEALQGRLEAAEEATTVLRAGNDRRSRVLEAARQLARRLPRPLARPHTATWAWTTFSLALAASMLIRAAFAGSGGPWPAFLVVYLPLSRILRRSPARQDIEALARLVDEADDPGEEALLARADAPPPARRARPGVRVAEEAEDAPEAVVERTDASSKATARPLGARRNDS